MDVDQLFSALANPVRRQLLMLLLEGPRNAGALAMEFDLSRPAISEHLHLLQEATLIVGTPSGRERRYALNLESLAEVDEWLKPFYRYWCTQLTNLSTLLEENP